MTHFDVFNGDADGICALHQWRLSHPEESELITGVKRDIALLAQVNASCGDVVTVLDVSLDKNREALLRTLDTGARVTYADHHFPGEVPQHPGLVAHIDTAADTCTGLIIDKVVNGAHRPWAVVAAFGDNLDQAAHKAAGTLDLAPEQIGQLQQLGVLLNYNGYGSSIDDLHFNPADLYRTVKPHRDPFSFINDEPAYAALDAGYHEDHERVQAIGPTTVDEHLAIYILPDAPFARRISGVRANELASAHTSRAHALLSTLSDDSYLVSVRAPLDNREGADALCRQFDTGGGRKAAAGINRLPASKLTQFEAAMRKQFG